MLPRAVSAQQWNLSGVESAKCIRPAVQFFAFLMFMDGINRSDIKILKGIAEHSLITFFFKSFTYFLEMLIIYVYLRVKTPARESEGGILMRTVRGG